VALQDGDTIRSDACCRAGEPLGRGTPEAASVGDLLRGTVVSAVLGLSCCGWRGCAGAGGAGVGGVGKGGKW